jgi:hypothetical protein
MEHYYWLLKGFNNTSMANHKIIFFTEEQLSMIQDKATFLCGESDPLGDTSKLKAKMQRLNMQYRTFKGVGHGINHEISKEINKFIIDYFSYANIS